LRVFLLSLLLGACAAAAPEAAPEAGEEWWYRVEIGGEAAGFAVERESGEGDTVISESEMELSLARGATEVSLSMASRFVETAAGEPVEMSARQGMGQLPLTTEVRFLPDRLEVRSTQGESTTAETLPRPQGPWLPPAAAARLVAARIEAGADSISYRTLDPLLGVTPFEVALTKLGGPEPVTVPRGTLAASRWEQRALAGSGVTSTLYLDEAGTVVKSVTPLVGVELTLLLADRETARDRRGAPELLVRSFVRPDRPIAAPRRLARATYRLRAGGRDLPALPEAGGQTVERGADWALVRVATGAGSPTGAVDAAPLLRATPYLNHEDPAVARLTAEGLSGVGAEPARRAEALRAFVHRYLQRKDLATGFATASEAAQRRSGDCTEHAVLLAALLRGAGIPSRVVAGLLYVEDFAGERDLFGYHMWTQALLAGRWTDLDAMTAEPFDAAHIALATSPLDEGEGLVETGALLASLMGSLAIEVVAAEPR
jgi:hypothetical protein